MSEKTPKYPLEVVRHSMSHVFALAIERLYPGAKFGFGPAIDDGFYQDIELTTPLSEKDFEAVAKEMGKIIMADLPITHREVPKDEARKIFTDRKQPYKVEHIEDLPGDTVGIATMGEREDLCRGGHVERTIELANYAFKLDRLAGAYWKNDATKAQLQRVYGLVFASKHNLKSFLAQREEAKKRDHRVVGKELGLFVFSDLVGKGLPLFTARGATVRRELERFIVDEEIRRGYVHVITPEIAKTALYEKSGHYPYYKDSMYPLMQVDEEKLILRPMTCPHHFELYNAEPHSYKDLPMRIAEVAHLYRYEQSGELSGLVRVRTFSLADAHIIVAKDGAKKEIEGALELIEYMCAKLGLKPGEDYLYRLSLGDRADTKKYFKDDAAWDHAESVLRDILQHRDVPMYEAQGEAAFYGPKIDIQMKNVMGKEDTAFTVQYDFVMPDRFDLAYTAEDGSKQRPVVIHRSSIGCIERLMAFLIEKYSGVFPLWLAPEQVRLIPVADAFTPYAQEVAEKLRAQLPHLRLTIDEASESVGKKIRSASKMKVPYAIVLGEQEKTKGTFPVRAFGAKEAKEMSMDDLVAMLAKKITEKDTVY